MGKIAFVFAGQGAQSVGMGKALYDRYDCVKRIFDKAGDHVKRLAFEGPAAKLQVTVNAQPCLYAMDLACAAVLNEHGVTADGVAGFSLGEIPAVVYSGLMDEVQGYEFVCFRAQVMHACALEHKGEMVAVMRLSNEKLEETCARLGHAYPVNYNCPGQTVVACSENSTETLLKAVAEQGGKGIKLAVSGAFHSPFMDEASDKMAEYLKDMAFGEIKVPVYSNVTAKCYANPIELLSRQVNSPVLWQKTIENMIMDGFETFVEVGAGKTLSGLIKKINGNVQVLQVCDVESLEHTLRNISALAPNGGNHA